MLFETRSIDTQFRKELLFNFGEKLENKSNQQINGPTRTDSEIENNERWRFGLQIDGWCPVPRSGQNERSSPPTVSMERVSRYLNDPQDITFSVRAMFRVCKMTALCIRSRISPSRAPNSSLIASSTSVDHPPKTSMMMLYCWMSYPGNCCLSFQRRGPYLVVFSSCFFSLFSVHGQLISTTRTFFFS